MSPAKDSTVRARQRPHRRATSFAGFFSKIFPTNRPEQGGTRRPEDPVGDNDSAYEDLGINPNELTDWNFARDKPPGLVATKTIPKIPSSHRKVRSWAPQRKVIPRPSKDTNEVGVHQFRRKSVHGIGQDLSTRGRPVTSPLRKSGTLTRAEIAEALKSKEESRRNRRSLKESGDWLGVQGADPYSGQFSILTPTTTLSSDTTSTSTRNRLTGLTRKKEVARLAYEEIKLIEEEEKEKAKQEKQLSKLGKIERVKEDLRRQHDLVRWSQHKRQWSSAAEPTLSPIAQSVSNLTGSNSGELAALPSSSHLSQPAAGVQVAPPGAASLPSSENTQPRVHKHFADRSTDTIIHKSPAHQNTHNIASSPPVIKPPGLALGRGQDLTRSKSEKPFLWRRRRRTIEPGGLVRSPDMGVTMSKTNTYLGSNSLKQLPTGPLGDVAIPDYHIHLALPEMGQKTSNQSISPGISPSNKPTQTTQETMEENKTVLIGRTNLLLPRAEQDHPSQDISEAIATSSQSKPKGIMKPSSIPQKLVRSRFSSVQAKNTREHQNEAPSDNQPQSHTNRGLPSKDTQESQRGHLPTDLQRRKIKLEEAADKLHRMRCRIETLRRESASIPTTITTGSAPDRQNHHGVTPSRPEAQTDQTVKFAGIAEGLVTPKSWNDRVPCIASTPAKSGNGTCSHPATSQSGSPSPVLAQEIAETGIASIRPVTPGRYQTPKSSTPSSPRIFQTQEDPIELTARDNVARNGAGGSVAPPAKHTDGKEVITQTSNTSKRENNSVISPIRTLQVRFRQGQNHHMHEAEEHTETMIQEAARIAMLRSWANAVAHHSPSGRVPSPIKKQQPTFSSILILRNSKTTQQRQKAYSEGEGGAGTGVRSKLRPSSSMPMMKREGEQKYTLLPHAQNETDKRQEQENEAGADAIMTLTNALATVCTLGLGFARAWWAAVEPAFDQHGELWRRRRAHRSSWRDVGTFASAAAFCAACAAGAWYGLGAAGWVIGFVLAG
ncbi:hypothetical protein F5X99DRAFT_80524 [Biscogniauxia marginata]|nr:hypothetical protein F5X99DRAFT_80524 [Biscogniauxia marginata]